MEDTPPAPAKETAPEKKEKPEASDHSEEPSWIKGYPASLKNGAKPPLIKKPENPNAKLKKFGCKPMKTGNLRPWKSKSAR